MATLRLAVVDKKANSTPPCPCPFQNWRGSTEPDRPRYMVDGFERRPSLTMAELMQCSVVT